MFFLNCNYIHYRPHKDRNMKSMPMRQSVSQDSKVFPTVFMGNLTASNLFLQGRLTFDG